MGVALGAFARTAYVFPEDKGKKETVTVRVSGVKFSGDGKQPLILVDGREVKTLDSLDANRIESISVLKDSTVVATYGDKGKDGVILVELKKTGEPGGAVQAAGLKGKVVKITRVDTAGTDKPDEVRVVGYGTRPKGGTVELNTDGIAKSYQFTVKSNSSLKRIRLILSTACRFMRSTRSIRMRSKISPYLRRTRCLRNMRTWATTA